MSGNFSNDFQLTRGLLFELRLAKEDFKPLGILNENILVTDGSRNDVVKGKISYQATFNLYFFALGFQLNFMSCMNFSFRHYPMCSKQLHGFVARHGIECIRCGFDV